MSSSPGSSMSTSASTLRAYHFPEPVLIPPASVSGPSSPHSRSSLDNSPPDSPLSASTSSLPSVSSSFFFSSAAASPPHPHPSQFDQGLVIPSLTLPTALRRSTAYGQTLGNLRILVLVRKGSDTSVIPALVSDDNENIVDAGSWEKSEHGRSIKASTDWLEHNGPYGQEKFEPLQNVEFIEFPAYDTETNVDELINNVKSCVQAPFQSISDILHPKQRASSVLSNLLSSPYSPLYTALVLLLPVSKSPDGLDRRLVEELGPCIPIISLPNLPKDGVDKPGGRHVSIISSFQPHTLAALRTGLFRSPETVALLRYEAADRFMRWREIECTVQEIFSIRNGAFGPDRSPGGSVTCHDVAHRLSWDKARWESEWMPTFSVDVAKRLREGTITQCPPEANELRSRQEFNSPSLSDHNESSESESAVFNIASPAAPAMSHDKEVVEKSSAFADSVPSSPFGRGPMYDPLHFPSLLIFSISLLGPLKERFDGSLSFLWDAMEQVQVRVALIGGFVVGLGVGLVIR